MNVRLSKGLDIPISGEPSVFIEQGEPIEHVALLGMDYIGMKPSMAVKVGDHVAAGQLLFTDKQNPAVTFTAPISGEILAINRGERRKFESLVIKRRGDERLTFPTGKGEGGGRDAETIKTLLIDSGLWTSFRTRPYGKIAAPSPPPSSLFITAMDTSPLAPPPEIIIGEYGDDFLSGLEIVRSLAPRTFLCSSPDTTLPGEDLPGILSAKFAGPHPAGLPSTNIHFLDPVGPGKEVWHIGYQDVIAIGSFFRTGSPDPSQIIALCGPGVRNPRLIKTLRGASIIEACRHEIFPPKYRLISGSVLTGHRARGPQAYLGRYHNQICCLPEKDGSGFLNWLSPGMNRFSSLPVFLSAFTRRNEDDEKLSMTTAAWGGRRAIFPVSSYEKVMPLNIIATALLKSLAVGNTEAAAALGCMELVEEDLALCSFVCPGKNNFGPMLRAVLTKIELDG